MGKLTSALKAGQTAIELGQHVKGFASTASEIRSTDKAELGRKAGRQAFHEGAETGKTMGKSWLKTFEVVPRLVCRGLQFLFAIVACGVYGNRVDADRKDNEGFSPEWILAIVIAGLSATTAVAFVVVTPLGAIPVIGGKMKLFKTHRAFPWDLTLFIAWIVVFGIFAGIFLKRDDDHSYKGSSTSVMKAAVWIDLVNAIFWAVTGGYGAFKTFLGNKVDRATDKVGQKLFSKKERDGAKNNYASSV